ASKTITLSDKTRLSYDILSVDIGGVVTPWFDVPDGGPRVVGAKPASHLFSTIIDVFNEKRHPTVVVVGGGLGGIEIAAALKTRGAEVTLLTGERGVAPNIHKKARKKISGRLSNLGINIVTKTKLTGVDRPRDPTGQDQTRSLAILENGKELVADLVVLATGVSSPPLFSSIPELLDQEGFLKINAYLASAVDGSIFAAGDCASLPLNDNQTRAPKAGVYAVKAGPTLAHNIRAAAEGRKFKWFDPPNHVLAITSLQSKGAIASKNRFVAGNPLLPSIKSLIDRRFIAKHSIARHSLGANKEKQPNTSVSK
ncbi:MAG: FAD-dependent oxidoreductase, partial [Pseudomonadota bacterium]